MVARALLISHYTQCVPDTANNHVRSSSNKVARARPSSARAETRQKKNEEHQQPHTSWLPFADVALFGFEWKEIVTHRIMNLCLNKIPKPYIRCTHKWVKRKTWTVLERKHQVILFIIVIIVWWWWWLTHQFEASLWPYVECGIRADVRSPNTISISMIAQHGRSVCVKYDHMFAFLSAVPHSQIFLYIY